VTTIAYRDGIMAADSSTYIHGGACRLPGAVKKIWRMKNGAVMGPAGSYRDSHALMRWFEKGEKDDPPSTGEVTALIISADRRVILVDGEAYREVAAPFYAIGSGADAALGAMYAGASAAEAISIAAKIDPYTGGEIHVEPLFGE